MTATYQKSGLQFLYPENWTLSDNPEEELPRAITLESPGGYIMWAVHLHPPGLNSDELIDETIDALRETYEDLELSTDQLDFDQWPGTACQALFFCLDFLVRIRLQVLQTPNYTMMLWYQCEDRDYDQQKLVLDAISTSLMQSL